MVEVDWVEVAAEGWEEATEAAAATEEVSAAATEGVWVVVPEDTAVPEVTAAACRADMAAVVVVEVDSEVVPEEGVPEVTVDQEALVETVVAVEAAVKEVMGGSVVMGAVEREAPLVMLRRPPPRLLARRVAAMEAVSKLKHKMVKRAF